MSDISKIDKNFAITTNLDLPDIEFFDCREEPFTLYGLCNPVPGERFHRVPADVAERVSQGVKELALHTSGGRVCFKTDSPYIAIKATRRGLYDMSHATQCMIGGFDLYVKNEDGTSSYVKTFMPPGAATDEYESFSHTCNGVREYVINMPLYGSVENLYMGLKKGSTLEKADGYRDIAPIVFYGSSITQGGCASRPGTCYAAIVSQDLNLDFINLGFSGSAKGEDAMIDYIASLSMGAFVCDYDHNAPSAQHLRDTHKKLVDAVRATHPDLPIICMPRPESGEGDERRDIVKKTVDDRIAEGDENIWFIDGTELFAGPRADNCTVDGSHPTDLGFFRMAMAVEKKLVEIFKF